jgi:hypothetical protein
MDKSLPRNFQSRPTQTQHTSRKIYTYNINSHSGIVRVYVSGLKEIPIIHIPPQVEVFTYTELNTLANFYLNNGTCQTLNYVCGKNKEHPNYAFDIPNTPLYKYTRAFAEMYFTPETKNETTPIGFYSGIIHCIPKTRDDGSTKTKEIIHNMDADPDYPGEACSNKSIHPYYVANTKKRIYDSDKNYSTFYKTVLTTNKHVPTREPPLEKIKKCGPLYLSEAIQLIQQHCKETYTDYETSIIQIHINGCLTLMEEPPDDIISNTYETTPFLEFFALNSDISDPKILDTPTTKVFVFIRHGIKFIIKISKSKTYNYDYTLYPEKLYADSLRDALSNTIGLSRDNMKDLPETIEITIPDALPNTKEEIYDFLCDYFINRQFEVSGSPSIIIPSSKLYNYDYKTTKDSYKTIQLNTPDTLSQINTETDNSQYKNFINQEFENIGSPSVKTSSKGGKKNLKS